MATGYGEKATRVNFTSTVTVKVFCHTESNSICGCAQPTFPGTLSRTVKKRPLWFKPIQRLPTCHFKQPSIINIKKLLTHKPLSIHTSSLSKEMSFNDTHRTRLCDITSKKQTKWRLKEKEKWCPVLSDSLRKPLNVGTTSSFINLLKLFHLPKCQRPLQIRNLFKTIHKNIRYRTNSLSNARSCYCFTWWLDVLFLFILIFFSNAICSFIT